MAHEKQAAVAGVLMIAAACLVMGPATPVLAGTNALFSSAYLGGGDIDANIGLSTSKTYLNAVNLHGSALTINGVSFEASTGGNPSGATWSFSGEGASVSGGNAVNVANQLGLLLYDFIYGGNPGTVVLSNLTAGQTYVLTLYNKSYDPAGNRVQTIFSSSGASAVFDEDMGASGAGYCTLLRYTFAATGTTEWLLIAPYNPGNTMHLYGFSTEQVFNKTWSSGAGWSSAAWSPAGAPNSVGANASFTAAAISSPTEITLDGATTLGHLQFAGTNAYTLAGGGNTLTLQSDVAGVATLNVTNGTHLISAPVTLNSDAAKLGDGTLLISGDIAGSEKGLSIKSGTLILSGSNSNLYNIVNNGALIISNSTAQTVACAISGAGSLTKKGAGQLTLSGSNIFSGLTTVGEGTLEIRNSTNVFQGGIAGPGLFVKSGPGTLFLVGTNVNTGDTIIQAGHVKMGGGSVVVSNFSFETHDVLTNGSGTFQYQPTGASWIFGSNSGINSNGGPFFTPNAPDGVAGGYIQLNGGGISQPITVSADGLYNISFMGVGRTPQGPNGLLLQVDGVSVGYWNEEQFSQVAWQRYSASVCLTAGVHTLAFVGCNRLGSDRSSCIDNVVISALGGRLSSNSILKIANGSTLDPGGATQTVQRLYLGGQPQTHGTYGASGSGAQFINNSYFTGSGVLDVLRDPQGFVMIVR